MDIKFLVIINNGEHSGSVAKVDMDEIWSNDNPHGWTYQYICGPHGSVLGEHESRKVAQTELDKYLECDAAEKGRYCYSHNQRS
ncbi:MAG: hypothetical protein GY804_11585 [Alphaproteobacteria bacterium]|nr:hypothetical protein [Alphaproteobacteria bacterium]